MSQLLLAACLLAAACIRASFHCCTERCLQSAIDCLTCVQTSGPFRSGGDRQPSCCGVGVGSFHGAPSSLYFVQQFAAAFAKEAWACTSVTFLVLSNWNL